MKTTKQLNRVRHYEYNREVLYAQVVEVTTEEMNVLLAQFEEEDRLFFNYHNPKFENIPGSRVHPNGKLEQLLKLKQFSIHIV